ncbi:MAG TPA: protein phosphatase 2C domain-containing protein [Candidatus Limnocylindrales bacterium]|nr:protein phosphatase 2C domain-containing protein [Candidatus Limnocylindrales bacterium]
MISYYGLSDVGRQRKQNEDTILTSASLFLVCDGMGGRKAGEVASRLAVDTIESETARGIDGHTDGAARHECLKTAIRLANGAIRKLAGASVVHAGMGTTVAAVYVDERCSRITYANVGDSRIYLIRSGSISQLSRDDSWANAAFGPDGADTATAGSLQHVLTKALGTHEELDFDVKDHDLVSGDVLLLCSDGLTSMLTDREILTIVAKKTPDLQVAGRDLIAAANAAGGRDNISAILVHYTG